MLGLVGAKGWGWAQLQCPTPVAVPRGTSFLFCLLFEDVLGEMKASATSVSGSWSTS